MDIGDLITRLKRGEELAFRELVYNYSARFMTIARIYSTSEDDAKDILQDAFVLVYRKVEKFVGTEEKAFYGWVKRIIINLCLSRNQRKYRSMEKSLDNMVLHESVDPEVISKLGHDEIMALVFNLPDGYRQVFALFAIEGYSHKEIAERLGIGESSSRSQYSRSRKMLKNQIREVFKVNIA